MVENTDSTDVDQSDVKEQFDKHRESIGRQELEEVIDGFEEKVRSIKQSEGPEFVRKAIGHAQLAYRLLLSWWEDRRNVPWRTITAVGAVLLYFINPMDLIPDMIPAAGLLDDATMIYIGFSLIQDDLIDFAIDNDLSLEKFGIDPEQPRPTISP